MRRDMDLAREILLAVEESQELGGWIDLELPDRSEEEVVYHVMLLDEAGLLEALGLSTMDGVAWKPIRLTWLGHEFLDAAREESRWRQATSIMKEKAGGLSFVPIPKHIGDGRRAGLWAA